MFTGVDSQAKIHEPTACQPRLKEFFKASVKYQDISGYYVRIYVVSSHVLCQAASRDDF